LSFNAISKKHQQIAQLAEAGLPYISVCTDPTTGRRRNNASLCQLGDINIAEPGALIGFAGPRVVKEVLGKRMPEVSGTQNFY